MGDQSSQKGRPAMLITAPLIVMELPDDLEFIGIRLAYLENNIWNHVKTFNTQRPIIFVEGLKHGPEIHTPFQNHLAFIIAENSVFHWNAPTFFLFQIITGSSGLVGGFAAGADQGEIVITNDKSLGSTDHDVVLSLFQPGPWVRAVSGCARITLW